MSKKNARPTRILIVHTGKTAIFPERDRDLLARRYTTETFGFTGSGSWTRLRARMKSFDIIIFWFLGRAAYWGMLLPPRTPKIISLIGGYETARLEELEYGSARSLWRRLILRRICKKSDRIVAVSEHTKQEVQQNLGIAPDRIVVLQNAIDTGYFVTGDSPRAAGTVLTVAHLNDVSARIKGFDILMEVARRLPKTRFIVVGYRRGDRAAEIARLAPKNVEFAGELSIENLREYYQSASVYFQPSRYESFGVSVIEAMSCGCIPVVSNRGALPEVVGDGGYVLDRLETEHVANILRAALNDSPEARYRARARVVEHFDIGLRGERLAKLIDDVLDG